jgi:hypothetical protein
MKCLSRNEASKFKVMDSIMHYVAKVIAHARRHDRRVWDSDGMLIGGEKSRNSERNLLQCHFIHHEC